jgi:hypothetical protein
MREEKTRQNTQLIGVNIRSGSWCAIHDLFSQKSNLHSITGFMPEGADCNCVVCNKLKIFSNFSALL